MNDACARWEALADREAIGEPLNGKEQQFLRNHAKRCHACGSEQRVWADLAAILDTPARSAKNRKTAVIVTALAAAAAVTLAWVGSKRQPVGVPSARTYEARALMSLLLDGKHVQPGAKLAVGSTLSADRGRTCLSIEPAVTVCCESGGRLRISELSASKRRLELLQGKLIAQLDPQPKGSSFGIVTREGSAVAVGTAFSVEVPERGPVLTRVLHGVVALRSITGNEQKIFAHQRAAMSGAPATLARQDEQRELSLLSGESSAANSIVEAHDPAPTDGVPQPAPTAVVAEPAPTAVAAEPARKASYKLTASDWLAVARQHRAHGNDEAALSAYRSLLSMYGHSHEAHSALVPYGELLLSSGRARLALNAFDRYLTQGGALSEEAAFGRIRALRALGPEREAQAAIDHFMRTYPQSPLRAGLRQP